MKSASLKKAKRVKLQVDTEINFRLIGISSHENDYRLVWAINNQLQMQFVRTENLVYYSSKLSSSFEFSRFLYTDDDRILTYFLISNRCPDSFLIPEMKKMDFFLQVIGEPGNEFIEMLVKSYRRIDIVSAVFLIDPLAIRGIEGILTS